MREPTPANPYEIYCTHCRVSFPVETRTCLHCGRPIGRGPPAVVRVLAGRAGEAEGADIPARTASFSPLTLVWVVAAVAMVIYRACT